MCYFLKDSIKFQLVCVIMNSLTVMAEIMSYLKQQNSFW